MKYVFFDIDGTIRGKSREITKRNREAICKLRENGHKAFLCTGRAPVSITQDILDVGFDGVKSAIDLMEAEVKSTADDDRDAQETMDTDPVLSEDIPESSIEPEVDDSLDADEWRRYL